MSEDATVLQTRLARAEERIRILERMIEESAHEVFVAHEASMVANQFLSGVQDTLPVGLLVVIPDNIITRVNSQTTGLSGYSESELIGMDAEKIFPVQLLTDACSNQGGCHRETYWKTKGGTDVPVLMSVRAMLSDDGTCTGYVCIAIDQTERRRLELQLRLAQKLESIGQLAAGIAHELNTPIQFVGDSLHFIAECYGAVWSLNQQYRALLRETEEERRDELLQEIERDEADLPYYEANVPPAIERTQKGLERIAHIVQAMREFSHPAQREMLPTNLHKAIETVLVVARNEYKYVAEVETVFGDLPEVTCVPDDMHQVLLNLIVNAAHAIGDARKDGSKGLIRISTGRDGDLAVISVEDDGCGIPEKNKARIFDAFFTTKEPGRGTGQGLAIVHALVVERHKGSISIESTVGKGTTFAVRLPIQGAAERRAA